MTNQCHHDHSSSAGVVLPRPCWLVVWYGVTLSPSPPNLGWPRQPPWGETPSSSFAVAPLQRSLVQIYCLGY